MFKAAILGSALLTTLSCFAAAENKAPIAVSSQDENKANDDNNNKNEKNTSVEIGDVSRVIVDKDSQIDVKTLLSQIDAMLDSNPERTKNIDKSNFKISMLQARTFEEVLYAAAQKISLQNVPEIKEQIDMARRQILVRAYISKVMRDRIKEEDLKILYGKVTKEYPKPGIEIGHILVKDENTAKEVIAALDRGEQFEEVAKKYSVAASKNKGGHEDVIPLDALTPQMEELRNLNVGQHVRKPLKSSHGYHIVATLAKKNVEAPTFDAIRKNLEGELFKVELEKLTKTLLKTINVKGYNDKGEEIDILPLLMKQISPENVSAKTSAPAVEEKKQLKEDATSEAEQPKVEQKNETSEESVESQNTPQNDATTENSEDKAEESGAFDKALKWVKSFF